ncbi:hypothetical protein SCLCIDRAFT_871844 [Scleroderma citrinum Foug A]|uniref:Uncharacterized protein n=1 Tax=Scleroderma citrinum Foug A TaxID=1036808 RepID=A0A0C3A9A8_9AGAM|nr:hypothetical protein SCLCIDRAFT_871844 [Scleroderma citrinum Foug A]
MFTLLSNSVFRFETMKVMNTTARVQKKGLQYFYTDARPLIYKGCCTLREMGSSNRT